MRFFSVVFHSFIFNAVISNKYTAKGCGVVEDLRSAMRIFKQYKVLDYPKLEINIIRMKGCFKEVRTHFFKAKEMFKI